MKEIEPSLH